MKIASIYFIIIFSFHFNLFQGQSSLPWYSFNSLFAISSGCRNGLWHPPYKLNARPLICDSLSPSKLKNLNDNISLTENKSSPSDIFLSDSMVESLSNSPDSMPSFTEWKKKMLSENGDQGQVLAHSDSSSKIASSVDLPTSNIKGSTERVRNYASYECGAKVIASNPEAESTSRLLNEMMDEYLLNPCKAKIWFVIELCESLRPSSLQLANFELFSSTPKDFLVFGSDQYPTREWLSLGSFTAQDIRGLQRFELTSQSQYLKYIKVEMLSNYGYEHYCPLSVIRVYGTSMVEEFDAIERSSRTKNIETLTDDEKNGIESSTAEESLESDKSKQNLLGSAREVVINMVKKAAMALSKTPSLSSANCTNADEGDDENELDLFSHLFLLKMISKLESQRHLNCSKCLKQDTYSNGTINFSLCNYLELLLGKKMYTTLCKELVKESDLRFKCLNQLPLYLNITIEEFENVTLNDSTLPLVLPKETLLFEVDAIKINISNDLSESLNEKDKIISLKTESPEPSLSSTPSLKIVPSSTEASLPSSSSFNEPNNVIDLSFSLVANQTLINATKNESLLSTNESIDINKIQASSDSVSVSSVQSPVPHPPTQPVGKPLVQSSQLPSNGPNVIPLSGTQSKESVFIRMSNKIRALEVNLSLSSQYLEELSQSYRKNMEEMQKAFNRTITKLNETARFAAQQDDKQQEMLEDLQRKYLLVEERVALLVNEKETLHWQFIEIHILLLIIEIIIMICIFSVCIRRLSSRFDESRTYQCNLNSFYFKSKLNHSLKRPSSTFEDISNPSPAKNKRIEENLIIVEPSYPIFAPILPIKNKKRRKKKTIDKDRRENVDPQAKTEPVSKTHLPSESKTEPRIEYKMESKFDSAMNFDENKSKVETKIDPNFINLTKSSKQPFNMNFDSNQFSLTIDKLNLATDKDFHLKQSNRLLSKSNSSSSSGISSDSNLSNKTIKERQLISTNENSLTNIIKNNSNSNLSTKSLFNWKKFLKFEKK